ncbi:hypothetical protein [Parasediminibacterium sp. JCM 36343]|uniref:hypothetical protein n=1 Tax=Parasediminibacterium sp. JCM 36343 TaxID=3374279 RepID=UPI00397A67EF
MKIITEKDHEKALEKVLALMNKGEANLTATEAKQIRQLGLAIQSYENSIYNIPTPKTLQGMLELKMYEMKLKRNELADLLGLTEIKLARILDGKKSPDIAFLKAAYQKLHIDASFLIEHA